MLDPDSVEHDLYRTREAISLTNFAGLFEDASVKDIIEYNKHRIRNLASGNPSTKMLAANTTMYLSADPSKKTSKKFAGIIPQTYTLADFHLLHYAGNKRRVVCQTEAW